MKKQTYFCKHFSICERKELCKSMCKRCPKCQEDPKDVIYDGRFFVMPHPYTRQGFEYQAEEFSKAGL